MPLAVRASMVALVMLAATRAAGGDTSPTTGERLYRAGVLRRGSRSRASARPAWGSKGLAAACATCHRRSGLGSWEGQTVIPPIIGRYLFRPGARNVEDEAMPHVQGYVPHRDAYTEATLARAIREGVDPRREEARYLMPRYALDDATMASLIAYLKALTAVRSPA